MGRRKKHGTWGSVSPPKARYTDLQAGGGAEGLERGYGVTGDVLTGQGWEDWGPKTGKRPCFPSPLQPQLSHTSAEADCGPDRCPECAAEPTAEPAEGAAGGALDRFLPPLRPLLAGHEDPWSPVGLGRRTHTLGEAGETLRLHTFWCVRSSVGALGSWGPMGPQR